MNKHPPICPKTEWKDDVMLSLAIRSDPLGFIYHELRARFQACAWQDRARRYEKVAKATIYHEYTRWAAAQLKCIICEDIARAWREWEKNSQ